MTNRKTFINIVSSAFRSIADHLLDRPRLRKLQSTRQESTIDEFIQYFEERDVPLTLLQTIYNYLREYTNLADFPVLPTDSLQEVYLIGKRGGFSLFEVIDDISLDIKFDSSSWKLCRDIDRPIETVDDLVMYLAERMVKAEV